MKWLFFWEDEGENGEHSFIIEAEDYDEAYDKAYNDYGPQVNDMFYKVVEQWISTNEKLPEVIDVRIKLTDGSELNVWTQADGDYWSELLKIFINPEKVTHWMPITLAPPQR